MVANDNGASPDRLDLVMDSIGGFVGRMLGMCGEGRPGNWAVRISDRFFTDCPCCLFWRGIVIGGLAAGLLVSLLGAGLGWLHTRHMLTSDRAAALHARVADLEGQLQSGGKDAGTTCADVGRLLRADDEWVRRRLGGQASPAGTGR